MSIFTHDYGGLFCFYNSNATFGVSALLTNIYFYISVEVLIAPLIYSYSYPTVQIDLNGFDTIPCYFHTVLHELNEGFFF